VARTSAFEFKGKNVNIKTMGDELGATHLIDLGGATLLNGDGRAAARSYRANSDLDAANGPTSIQAERPEFVTSDAVMPAPEKVNDCAA
jgi:TolB-like protein